MLFHNPMTILNHHSAAVLPYFIDDKGKLHFIAEQKDSGYKPPFFDNGLNLLGGNWEKGKGYADRKPSELLQRKIAEEFWQIQESYERLNELLKENFLENEQEVTAKYDSSAINRISEIADILTDNNLMADFIVTVNPPVTKTPLAYASSVYGKELDAEEYDTINKILGEFNNRVTTDNLKKGNQTLVKSVNDCNMQNTKFAWGYDHTLNHLIDMYDLGEEKIYRPLSLITVEPFGKKFTSFSDVEKMGYNYDDHS